MYHKIIEHKPDTKTHKSRKLIRSGNSGEEHTVSIRRSDARWSCSCKGWIFKYQKLGQDCQHIQEVKSCFNGTSRYEVLIRSLDVIVAAEEEGVLDSEGVMYTYQNMKDFLELALFYYENTPGGEQKYEQLKTLSDKAKAIIIANCA